jgi:phage baseplate assembly protein W
MNGRRHLAWRFDHPDQCAPGQQAGLRLSAQGEIDTLEGTQAIKQAIRLLLSTTPGERVMRPDYGCSLFRLVFAPNDDTTAGLAIHYVRRAVERWEPRVELLRVDARRSEGREHVLEIELEYRIRATQDVDRLAFAYNLTGEEG